MGYIVDIWRFPDSTEYEYKFAGNYGAKGERRTPKREITSEEQERKNRSTKEKKLRRLIKANFSEGDYWVTLKYPKGERPTLEEVKKHLKDFLSKMRREYKKKEEAFKYIYRLEVGKHGGVHIHILLNRSRGDPATDELLRKAWTHGRLNFETVYDLGNCSKLASYIAKDLPGKQKEQLGADKKSFLKYSSSRNLVRPVPERREYRRRTLRKFKVEGIKPKDGYTLDKETVIWGVNPLTGMSYLYYTEVKIRGQ